MSGEYKLSFQTWHNSVSVEVVELVEPVEPVKLVELVEPVEPVEPVEVSIFLGSLCRCRRARCACGSVLSPRSQARPTARPGHRARPTGQLVQTTSFKFPVLLCCCAAAFQFEVAVDMLTKLCTLNHIHYSIWTVKTIALPPHTKRGSNELQKTSRRCINNTNQ